MIQDLDEDMRYNIAGGIMGRDLNFIWFSLFLLFMSLFLQNADAGSKPSQIIPNLPEAPRLSATRYVSNSMESFHLDPLLENPYVIPENELLLDSEGDESILLFKKGIRFEDLKEMTSISLTHPTLAQLNIETATIVYHTVFVHKYVLKFTQAKEAVEIELDDDLFKTQLLKIFKLRITLKEKGRFKIHLVIPVLF